MTGLESRGQKAEISFDDTLTICGHRIILELDLKDHLVSAGY